MTRDDCLSNQLCLGGTCVDKPEEPEAADEQANKDIPPGYVNPDDAKWEQQYDLEQKRKKWRNRFLLLGLIAVTSVIIWAATRDDKGGSQGTGVTGTACSSNSDCESGYLCDGKTVQCQKRDPGEVLGVEGNVWWVLCWILIAVMGLATLLAFIVLLIGGKSKDELEREEKKRQEEEEKELDAMEKDYKEASEQFDEDGVEIGLNTLKGLVLPYPSLFMSEEELKAYNQTADTTEKERLAKQSLDGYGDEKVLKLKLLLSGDKEPPPQGLDKFIDKFEPVFKEASDRARDEYAREKMNEGVKKRQEQRSIQERKEKMSPKERKMLERQQRDEELRKRRERLSNKPKEEARKRVSLSSRKSFK